MKYDFTAIEKKWQERWEQTDAFRTEGVDSKKHIYFYKVPSFVLEE